MLLTKVQHSSDQESTQHRSCDSGVREVQQTFQQQSTKPRKACAMHRLQVAGAVGPPQSSELIQAHQRMPSGQSLVAVLYETLLEP